MYVKNAENQKINDEKKYMHYCNTTRVTHLEYDDLSSYAKNRLAYGGLRKGDPARSLKQRTVLMKKLPHSCRVKSNIVDKYVINKNVSHLKPYKHGGSNKVSNILGFENAKINRIRQAKRVFG